MPRFLVALVAASVLPAAGPAQPDDAAKAEAKLAKAREDHSAALADIRGGILKQIEDRDAAERRKANPDLDKLKGLKADRVALEEKGELPKWTDTRVKDRIAKANAPLVVALVDVKAAYTRAKDDDKAAAIEKELVELRRNAAVMAVKGLGSDDRVLFVHDAGYWIKGRGKDWFGTHNGNPVLWLETGRTKEYVEIKYVSGEGPLNLTLRIYADRAAANWGDGVWKPDRPGKWSKE
ncbi:MAG: hypothetical protein K2X87_06820 [Gemmataceae bacterium]|nr:hypothetical protein [Gemmataceae bacterium]